MIKRILAVFAVLALLVGPPVTYAACTQALATSAKGNWLSGMYRKGDTYKIAFYTSAASYGASTIIYATGSEITGTNYSAGGYTLDAAPTYGTSGTTYWMDWPDEINSTVTFDNASNCAIIYDAVDRAAADCTASGIPYPCCTGTGAGANCANPILGVWTFTSVQPSAGTLTVTFPANDASNAIIRIAQDGETAPPMVVQQNAATDRGRDPGAVSIGEAVESLFTSLWGSPDIKYGTDKTAMPSRIQQDGVRPSSYECISSDPSKD